METKRGGYCCGPPGDERLDPGGHIQDALQIKSS